MVGRDHEQTALRQAWIDGARLVVVQGVAGIGKSRLVREFAHEVTAGGGRMVLGRCTQADQDVPLRPIGEALLGAARAGWGHLQR